MTTQKKFTNQELADLLITDYEVQSKFCNGVDTQARYIKAALVNALHGVKTESPTDSIKAVLESPDFDRHVLWLLKSWLSDPGSGLSKALSSTVSAERRRA